MSQEATIRRGVRNARYAAIPNHVFEDARLTMEARWLLGYLLSKPDNWTVVIGDIIKKGSCGRDKARKMIAELVEFGYAEREQQRDDGKFGSSVLVIFDEPRNMPENMASGESVAFLPQTEMPSPVSPSPVSPSPVKSAHSNNLDSANTDYQNQREGVREDQNGEDSPVELRKRYRTLEIGRNGNPWPNVLSSGGDWGFRHFVALTPEERHRAEDRRDAFLAACPKITSGKRKGDVAAPPLGVYLRDKRFDLVDAIAPKAVKAATKVETVSVAPFGPVWAGLRMLPLLSGPVDVGMPADTRQAARSMFETIRRSSEARAQSYLARKGISFDGQDLVFPDGYEDAEYRRRVLEAGYPETNRLNALAAERGSEKAGAACAVFSELCEAVPVGSAVYERWRDHHAAMNWPFVPDPGSMRVVYFPKGGPEGLDEFEVAARAAIAEERSNDHAA
ncbi:helix-turn-helix domain-containing protein [Ensifer sp. Root142]|uniref:helix-turn-helix domain-containing protein n=1 Tax=Ensifer sp. Root142 TaxID=1736461 RepID=UPI000A43EEB8|nr:helix-turn-helix domain-containing protein [Ensifer sp. Root142]